MLSEPVWSPEAIVKADLTEGADWMQSGPMTVALWRSWRDRLVLVSGRVERALAELRTRRALEPARAGEDQDVVVQ